MAKDRKGKARLEARLHLASAIVFFVQIPVALVTGLKDSTPYLVLLSLWALVSGHLAGYQAAKSDEHSV